MKAYILRGLPGSGKSTWAKEQQGKAVVNNDTIRQCIYNETGVFGWSRQVEAIVKERREKAIRALAANGTDVIVDNTHMNHKTFNQIKDFCALLGYEVEVVDFTNVPIAECIRRDSLRRGHEHVGEEVIRDMWKKFCFSRPLPNFIHNNLNPCIICDLDGTLADPGDRNPYNQEKVIEDTPRYHVLITIDALMRRASGSGTKLFFFSGRSERCKKATNHWLQGKCFFQPDQYTLVMRRLNDKRRDSEVKREMYDQHIKDKYNVFAVFDDRPQVIRECWQVLGLPVFNCGLIDVEF